MPLPEEIFDRLGGSSWFTTLDLRSGFNQIETAEEDKCKTAFHGVNGHYEYNMMPFGLVNATAVFQGIMDQVLRGMEAHVGCFVDDILITSSTEEEHLQRIEEVLDRLGKAGLKCHPKKCKWMMSTVEYLGHKIGREVAPQLAKVACIDAVPSPRNVSELRTFLGMIGYYRRHILQFSQKARPVTQLLGKDVPWKWGRRRRATSEH